MGLKTFTIDFAEFSQETLIRSNYKTAILGIEIKNHFQKSENKFVRIKEYFDIISGFAFKSADYEQEGLPLIRIGDVGNNFDENNMVFLPEDYKEDYQRFLLKKNDIVVSLTGDGKLKSDLILEDDKYLLNQRVGSLRAKEDTNILFFYYLINYYSLTKKQFYWWSNGKTQLNISPFDFLKIKIPLIPKPKQDQIVAKIEPIEKKIKELKAQITPPQEVINKVFASEFGFNLEKFEELKKIKNYYLDISLASKNKDLRNSVAFHHESVQFVMSELKKITKSKIKHFIDEPIVLGASISPSNFDEKGENYYISMATVKNYCIELDDSQLVSSEYAKSNLNKSVTKYDIIMTRSGVAIGKFALIDEDVNGIFADFTMRIRLNNYNPYFAYYYFRSEYFQHLIHSNKKGLQNKNIFPSQIQEFPMIDIPLKAQQKIVDEIKAELDKLEEIKSTIERERNKIDEIIENAII